LTGVKAGFLLSAALLVSLPARADSVDDARALFTEGSASLKAGRPQEALEKLERSYALVPSPNTELLLGRALREVGRKVDALRALEHAEVEARRRGNAGVTRYGQTEAAAHAEAASLRAQLGTLRVRVAHPEEATLSVDGIPVPIAPEGDTTVVHEPGRVEVAVARSGEAEARQIVTVDAGATVQMEFASREAKPLVVRVPEPARREPAPVPWAVPAAITAGGVMVVAGGIFTGFALKSGATYDALSDRCGPRSCGPADRADADAGKRDQTIANVALVVAGAAAAAALSFVVVKVFSRSDSPRVARGRTPGSVP